MFAAKLDGLRPTEPLIGLIEICGESHIDNCVEKRVGDGYVLVEGEVTTTAHRLALECGGPDSYLECEAKAFTALKILPLVERHGGRFREFVEGCTPNYARYAFIPPDFNMEELEYGGTSFGVSQYAPALFYLSDVVAGSKHGVCVRQCVIPSVQKLKSFRRDIVLSLCDYFLHSELVDANVDTAKALVELARLPSVDYRCLRDIEFQFDGAYLVHAMLHVIAHMIVCLDGSLRRFYPEFVASIQRINSEKGEGHEDR